MPPTSLSWPSSRRGSMVRSSLVAFAVVMLAVPVSASLVEDSLAPLGPANQLLEETTGESLRYQEDAGVHGDAPDLCLEATAERGVTLGGARTAGMLMDVDDESDAYVFELGEDTVGKRVGMDLLSGILATRHDVAFDVFAPGCTASVFDFNSTYYDPAAPEDPYTPPAGSTEVQAGGLTGYACGDEWKLLANQMGGIPAPATIYVEWTDGSFEYVPVMKSTPATVAMYLTTSHPDVTIDHAVIVLPEGYKGQFNLVHGFCGAVPGTPTVPPQHTNTTGQFTVQQAGTHIVVVSIVRGTVDKTVDTVADLAADPPTAVGVNCHGDICTGIFSRSGYDFGSQTL